MKRRIVRPYLNPGGLIAPALQLRWERNLDVIVTVAHLGCFSTSGDPSSRPTILWLSPLEPRWWSGNFQAPFGRRADSLYMAADPVMQNWRTGLLLLRTGIDFTSSISLEILSSSTVRS